MNQAHSSQITYDLASPNLTILQVLPALGVGGVEKGTIEVAIALKEDNMIPLVASSGGVLEKFLEESQIRHIPLNLKSKNPITMFKNVLALKDIIETYKVDLVHARSRAPAWSAYFACKLAKVPLVTTFHGTYNFTDDWMGQIKKFYNSIMVRGHKVIAISEFIEDHIVKNYDSYLKHESITVIPRGVNMEVFAHKKVTAERVNGLKARWGLPSYEKLLVMPARLSKWKGQLTFIAAVSILRKRGYPITAVMMGQAQGRHTYVESLKAKLISYQIDAFVTIDEACPDVPAAYSMADVIVHASTDPEAFGRVIVEGHAMKRPVVASRLGAPLEIINEGATGLLFEPGNPTDLADKIESILRMETDDRDKMVDKAYRLVKSKYTKDHMTTATLNLYKDVILEWAAQ